MAEFSNILNAILGLDPRKHLGNKIWNLSIPSQYSVTKAPKGGGDLATYMFSDVSECLALGCWRKHENKIEQVMNGTRQIWVAYRCRWSQRLSAASMDSEVASNHVISFAKPGILWQSSSTPVFLALLLLGWVDLSSWFWKFFINPYETHRISPRFLTSPTRGRVAKYLPFRFHKNAASYPYVVQSAIAYHSTFQGPPAPLLYMFAM